MIATFHEFDSCVWLWPPYLTVCIWNISLIPGRDWAGLPELSLCCLTSPLLGQLGPLEP